MGDERLKPVQLRSLNKGDQFPLLACVISVAINLQSRNVRYCFTDLFCIGPWNLNHNGSLIVSCCAARRISMATRSACFPIAADAFDLNFH